MSDENTIKVLYLSGQVHIPYAVGIHRIATPGIISIQGNKFCNRLNRIKKGLKVNTNHSFVGHCWYGRSLFCLQDPKRNKKEHFK